VNGELVNSKQARQFARIQCMIEFFNRICEGFGHDDSVELFGVSFESGIPDDPARQPQTLSVWLFDPRRLVTPAVFTFSNAAGPCRNLQSVEVHVRTPRLNGAVLTATIGQAFRSVLALERCHYPAPHRYIQPRRSENPPCKRLLSSKSNDCKV